MKKQTLRKFSNTALSAALALFGGVALAAPPEGVLDLSHANVRAVMALQSDVTAAWMRSPDVLGTAVGLDNAGNPALVIYVNQNSSKVADVIRALPPQLRGISINIEPTEKFVAYAGKPGGSAGGGTPVSHTAVQALPIKLGTSGGWRTDLANGYCCGGTLGALIQVNGSATTANNAQYILSNYHVFESDIVPGGNGLVATTGNYIIQPGLIDVQCNAVNSQNVATLVKLGSLPTYNVDCSIAQVISGQVAPDGSILEIGTISSTTAGASLNLAVKKSGRTTGLTRSKISGLNATISVAYENECAGGPAFTKTFSGQIVIANGGSKFLNSGDSGSLMVQDVATNPKAVGLLYAGSSTSAIANPIGQVLTFIGSALGGTATMVGNP